MWTIPAQQPAPVRPLVPRPARDTRQRPLQLRNWLAKTVYGRKLDRHPLGSSWFLLRMFSSQEAKSVTQDATSLPQEKTDWTRSEERRVGKEWREKWSTSNVKQE